MPSEPVFSSRRSRTIGGRLVGIAAYGVAVAAALCFLTLLVLRFVALPRVDSYRDDIASLLSRELGHPVAIDAIRTGWDGWNPRFDVQGLRIRDASDPVTQPLIELSEVSATVAWTSLLTASLRLKELVIVRPRLAVRRDAAGALRVAGFEVGPNVTGSGTVTDWVLRHKLIVVRDALVSWDDDLRHAPPLLLEGVQFRLENRFGRYRFGLTGTPPPGIAAPIDIRGEITDVSLDDWRTLSGRVYAQLDYADIAAWSPWLSLPTPIVSGQGALRLWVEFADGVARDAVADLELANVRTRLGERLPSLELDHLAGRITWQQEGAWRNFGTRGLALVDRDGTRIAATDLSLRYELAASGETTTGRATFNRLELASLVALAARLPMPEHLRTDLARYQPRGTLNDGEYAWEGPAGDPTGFKTRGSFHELGVTAFESMPGLSGISGGFDATQLGGTLTLKSRDVVVHLPKVFAEPIALDAASGRVRWERGADGVTIRLDEVEYQGADVAGTAQGSWKSLPKGPGFIDLGARVTRASAREAHRYVPLMVGADIRSWLRSALVTGRADDARLTLKGDLAKFPFADGKSGTFVIDIKSSGVTLDYAKGWPPVTGIDSELRLEGNRISVAATRANVLGATLGRTTATIADLSLHHPVLVVEGEADSATSDVVAYLNQSPLAKWTGGLAEGVQATGNGRLTLKLALALGKDDEVAKLAGSYQFTDNTLRFPGIAPLSQVNGRLDFTERELGGKEVSVAFLGGPAKVSIASRDGVVRLTGGGNADLVAARQVLDSPFDDRLAGMTDWQIALTARDGFAAWTLSSTLRGATLDFPPPLGKAASEVRSLKIERRAVGKDGVREALIVDYGAIGRLIAHRKTGAATPAFERALLLLGSAVSGGGEPERAGLTVRGNLDAFNLDEWLAIDKGAASRRTESTWTMPDFDRIDLEAVEFAAFGRRYDQLHLSARRAANNWQMRFNARQAEGTAVWEPAGSKLANGRFTAKLARFEMPAAGEANASAEATRSEVARREGSANSWPELDVTAERFSSKAGNLGRMELVARPDGTDWRVTKFALHNDAGRINASGNWKLLGPRQQTEFDVDVEVTDAAAFLARMGMPNDVKGAPTRLSGHVGWPGSPTDFAYTALAGQFKVTVGEGQFTKVDPGVGKLLGVLSLQMLPRRITLDFRDVFSEGFAFDTIAGNVSIANGVMHTDDLLVSGPGAKVNFAGDVDLERETQQLRLRVQPSLSSVISTGAGAAAVVLLAANPLVGAAVGAGTLLAQKLMKDPFEQIFSYQYAVSGSWSEPVVERIDPKPARRAGETTKEEGATR